ncbi:uncharacterized protein LOC62_06G007860 [Vanrija pseudolonga]|uniref:Uncharacterized protein n=1 Tax=Vanrija pseudolonga TaxID=143232 RepID=A0AAF0YCS4_9TREE|nr:hypothetical protein LOC62_06G007860 [Vanrija pseudolonga]
MTNRYQDSFGPSSSSQDGDRSATPSTTSNAEDPFAPAATPQWENQFMPRDYHLPLLTDNHVLYLFTTRTNYQLTRPETHAVKNQVEEELHTADLHKFSFIWLSKSFDAGPHGFLLQFSIMDMLELPQEVIVNIGCCLVVNAHTDVDAIRYYPRAVNDPKEVEVAPPGYRKYTFRHIP